MKCYYCGIDLFDLDEYYNFNDVLVCDSDVCLGELFVDYKEQHIVKQDKLGDEIDRIYEEWKENS